MKRKMDSLATADLTASYTARSSRLPSFLSNVSAQLSIRNLFNRDPPFYDASASAGYDYANADPLGRIVALTLKKAR